jgi:hypothetical protein
MYPHNVIDTAINPVNPFAAGASWLDLITLGVAAVFGLTFTAYLLRCYVQEFRRERRVRRRKQLARATCTPGHFRPLCLAPAENSQRVTDDSEEQEQLQPLPLTNLDSWRLQWIIPAHEQITLIWDKPAEESSLGPAAIYLEPRSSDNPQPLSCDRVTL